jgi:hypothetical protein
LGELIVDLPAALPDRHPAPVGPPDVLAEEEEQIRSILAADRPDQAARGYRALFQGARDGALTRLQAHPSDFIALQAAWMRVELTVPANEPARTVRPDRDALSWFLGFLEGRGRVKAPRWWADAILDAKANRRGNIYAGGLNEWPGRRTGPPPPSPPAATVELQGRQAVVRIGRDAVPVPEAVFKSAQWFGPVKRVGALVSPGRCYVAGHDQIGSEHPLTCVDRAADRVRWTRPVWGSYWGGTTGLPYQWVEVTEQGGRIVVFGVASTGFHVETFRADDGANLWRFSNGYAP